jgi:hypothetical protein
LHAGNETADLLSGHSTALRMINVTHPPKLRETREYSDACSFRVAKQAKNQNG